MAEVPAVRKSRRWPWLWLAFPLMSVLLYATIYLNVIKATMLQPSKLWQTEIGQERPPFYFVNGGLASTLYPYYAEDPDTDRLLCKVFAPAHYLDRRIRPDYWVRLPPDPPSGK